MLISKTCVKALCVVVLAVAPAAAKDPVYKYDPTWPKQLPNNWTMESITGIFADSDDHIWVLQRPRDFDKSENFAALNPPTAECCVQPPAVLEFNTEGDLLHAWGGPGHAPGWPS